MRTQKIRTIGYAVVLAALLGLSADDPSNANQSRVEAALTNIMTLQRPGQDWLAAIWDGNKYVQCRRMSDQVLRCESAGALMQPSLARVLVPERAARLTALGWQFDPSFGNYVQVFPVGLPVSQIAEKILLTLMDGYAADLANLEIRSDWIKSQPCPPRNGPSQNLAGMINDAPSMAATAARGCAYRPAASDETPVVRTRADLINIYGGRLAGEIQRLRINNERSIFIVLDTGGGYVQCAPADVAASNLLRSSVRRELGRADPYPHT